MRNPSRPAPTLRYFPGLPSMPCDTSRLKNGEWRVARRIFRLSSFLPHFVASSKNRRQEPSNPGIYYLTA
ncbi:hypothetical protein L1887_29189 [Cichorium endivia]|nr:hypothetical protein L1887_29189 [Cichorium endivia]